MAGSPRWIGRLRRDLEYLADGGSVYRVPLGDALAPGSYRLVVTAAAGKHEAKRELAFTVVPPGS